MGDVQNQTGLIVRDLGRMSYGEAFELQRRLQVDVIEKREAASGVGQREAASGQGEREAASGQGQREAASGGGQREAACGVGYLLLVEHEPPVITVSRRQSARRHLVATPEQIAAAGVEVAETDRGGDITYHGPGQLVVYPILDLNLLGLRVRSYMRFLEQVVIDTVGRFGITAHRDESATGVWVPADTSKRAGPSAAPAFPGSEPVSNPPSPLTPLPPPEDGEGDRSAKICAMGVRITRWVSMHGLALNVTTNLDHYRFIIPCGLEGRPVTSMRELLGDRCPGMDEVKKVLIERFQQEAARLATRA